MDQLFSECLIDAWAVSRRIPGRVDEDYEVFKCPDCAAVHLIDYEDGTIFVDPSDVATVAADRDFRCPHCSWRLREGEVILGPRAALR